ncbi:hypothetical protein FQA39_LY15930 [Lamprigera yunnana]|nr:hypothetical protein FQA39_LY15930 [Lamprigera yunnana]
MDSSNTDNTNFRTKPRALWRQPGKMGRRGLICLILSICLIVIIIIVLIVVLPKKNADKNESYVEPIAKKECDTKECAEAASKILSFMDPSVDPCDNFYLFACGKYVNETVIPDDKQRVTAFSLLNDLLQNQLRVIIEEPTSKDELKTFTLVKNLYQVCMDTEAIEKNAVPTVNEILKDIGGWPVLEGKQWNEDKFDWKWSIFKFRKHGLSTDNFMSFNLYPDFKNSSKRLINIDQLEIEFGRDNWIKGLKDDIIEAYSKYMVDLAVYFGADRKFAEYEVDTMITFRGQLANITIPPEERRNETALYNPMTLNELQIKYPSIKWLDLVNNVMAFRDRFITGTDIIVINVPSYMADLEILMRKTSKRVQANHAIFQAIRSLQTYLPEEVRKLQQTFEKVLYGTTTRKPRWIECMTTTTDMFDIASSALYLRKFFSDDSRKIATEMVSTIRDELVKILKTVSWMDDQTKETAVEKALAITADVGYADELLDDKKIEDYYSSIHNYHTDNYLYYIGNMTVFKTDKAVEKVWQVVNKTEWTTRPTPITPNAFYDQSENSIQLPAAILQGIFFDANRLNALNYGGIGQIIAHEFTHGFDDEGKQFDKEGNILDWWAEGTNEAFLEKAKCFIEQYSNITVPEVNLKLNGINTQGENIADNGGIKEAYLAYKSWVSRNGEEPMLPGLNYTSEQLFWISMGNLWCSAYRNEFVKREIINDSHSPPQYRVLIPLRNSEYFSKDFACAEGSNMNPKQKCHIW